MTSSSSCDGYCQILLRQGASEIFSLVIGNDEIPHESSTGPTLPPNRSVELTLRRGSARSLLRVLLEREELMRMTPGRSEWTLQLRELLRDHYGLADITVEEADPRDPSKWRTVAELTLAIEADPAFRRLHEALVAELEEVHTALAHDVSSRTWHRRGGTPKAGTLRVEADLETLRGIFDDLRRSLSRIARHPTRVLDRRRVLGRWRPGDAIGASAVHRLALGGDVGRAASGRLIVPRKLLLDRPELASDIEEHRHLRAGVLRLADRVAAVSRYCRKAVRLLREEEARWSEEALSQKIVPKIEALERIEVAAEELQASVRRLSGDFPFLREAGAPRTDFGPTPLFLGRPEYRQAYRAILEARRSIGGRYESEALRVRFRNLATLYEYWLFVRVVGLLRDMYGPPVGNRGFSLIDELYRPELSPGQKFRFRLPHGDTVTATYEPDIPPVSARTPERFRASFASAPLRPDVMLELGVPGRPPVILALDAKSGPRFRKAQERLQQTAGYLWLVHDPQTGHQPVRQLFIVHRDMDAVPVCNVTGYLDGRVSPRETRILGAVPARPGQTRELENAILRFLETFRARKWR